MHIALFHGRRLGDGRFLNCQHCNKPNSQESEVTLIGDQPKISKCPESLPTTACLVFIQSVSVSDLMERRDPKETYGSRNQHRRRP